MSDHFLIQSDVYAGLDYLKNNSIDLAITSPPYWGQRDYGFEGQIGNEKTHEEYIQKLLTIFSLLKKKLTSKGVFYLNIGDKYLSKYGNSKLGLIPYKLAYEMVKDGWILNDILIWYKPNHMPSSVKNRFVNSYEPVFVFSKNYENYFSHNKNDVDYSNILKIKLQPSKNKHIASYPEKLVLEILKLNKVKDYSVILDPFAGSGTTLKVINDLNSKDMRYKGIMIDNHEEYLEIIKNRCKLQNLKIKKLPFIKYNFKKLSNEKNYQLKLLQQPEFKYTINKKGFVKIFEFSGEYYEFLKLYENKSIKNFLSQDAITLIGCKDFNIDLIYETSKLNNSGWVIRNLIIVERFNKWYPIFMIVNDSKKIKYKFNYEKLNLSHKGNYEQKWHKINFIGIEVMDKFKGRGTGIVLNIDERYENEYPKYVIVKWPDNSLTREYVIYSDKIVNQNLRIEHINSIPQIFETEELVNFNNGIQNFQNNGVDELNFLKNGINYNGKYKDEKRINWGASPGARSSMTEYFFSVQRLYNVDQRLVCNYLNYKRQLKNISKSNLTDLFPTSYKHTVGHWLRNDFGGSLPTLRDWIKLSEILELEENYTNYVCKSALKLQLVKPNEHKIPEDFIKEKFINQLKKLYN
jgi:DNA modification methylase